MSGHNRIPRAFTLVELLVVVAIIGILIALLLPAVQAAREAARRTQCTNNIKQLGAAMQAYHAVHKIFPINWGDGNPDGSLGTLGHSWLTMILPHIEEGVLYDSIAFGQPLNYQNDTLRVDNRAAAATVVSTFICPSDIHEGTLENQQLSLSSGYGLPALTNYKAVSGSNWGSPDTLSGYSPDFVHKKEFYGYLGRNADTRNGLAKGDGIICAGWDGAVITGDFEIRDGLSNTLAIGESVPSWCAWSTWYWWLGSTATCGIPLNYEKPGVSLRDNYDDMGNTYGFMSRHGVGAIFGLADGSTRLINEAICGDGGSEDMRLYRALSTIDGGERAEVPE